MSSETAPFIAIERNSNCTRYDIYPAFEKKPYGMTVGFAGRTYYTDQAEVMKNLTGLIECQVRPTGNRRIEIVFHRSERHFMDAQIISAASNDILSKHLTEVTEQIERYRAEQ